MNAQYYLKTHENTGVENLANAPTLWGGHSTLHQLFGLLDKMGKSLVDLTRVVTTITCCIQAEWTSKVHFTITLALGAFLLLCHKNNLLMASSFGYLGFTELRI